jgi:hypothetical protein
MGLGVTPTRARPGRVLPAVLAAAAEAPLWFFPVAFLDGLLGGSLSPAGADLLGFVAAFAGAVGVSAALSGWQGGRGVPALLLVAAVALGVLEGGVVRTAQPGGLIAATLGSMLLGLRVGMLGLRDWREPVQLSFGVGAVVLLVVAAGSGFAEDAGRPLVLIAVPLFFVGSLASRAASARLAEGWTPGDGRRVASSLAALGAAIAAAGTFGGAGGLFQRLGSMFAPVVGAVFGALLWVVGQLARPFFWLAERFEVDVDDLREALERFRREVGERTGEMRPPRGDLLERIVGMVFILLIAAGLLILFRRLRGRSWGDEGPAERDRVPTREIGEAMPHRDAPRPRMRVGRAPPDDLVRRWYAEALVSLERLGLLRPPARTPGAFRGDVSSAYPGAAQPFDALTSAYERVRYGGMAPDRDALKALREERGRLRQLLRDARPVPGPPADAGEGSPGPPG